MPIYDYVCSNCRHRAEVLHGVHDESPRICSECGGQMRKAISRPAIVFKGSGWAKVDRRTARGGKQAHDAAADASADAAAKSGGPGEAGDSGGSEGAAATPAKREPTPPSPAPSGTKPKAPTSDD